MESGTEAAPTISALPTPFKGIEYRSRLEARWAVLFAKLGIRADYEPQGYDLPECAMVKPVIWEPGTQPEPITETAWEVQQAGNYLPDFWLPHEGAFLEIKPQPVRDARHPVLAQVSKKPVYVLAGNFPRDVEELGRMELTIYPPHAAPKVDFALALFSGIQYFGLIDEAVRFAYRFQFRL